MSVRALDRELVHASVLVLVWALVGEFIRELVRASIRVLCRSSDRELVWASVQVLVWASVREFVRVRASIRMLCGFGPWIGSWFTHQFWCWFGPQLVSSFGSWFGRQYACCVSSGLGSGALAQCILRTCSVSAGALSGDATNVVHEQLW